MKKDDKPIRPAPEDILSPVSEKGGGIAHIKTYESQDGHLHNFVELNKELVSVLDSSETVLGFTGDDFRTLAENTFEQGETLTDGNEDETIEQQKFRQPDTLLVPLTKAGQKIYDGGKTDFSEVRLVNVGTKKKEALVKLQLSDMNFDQSGITISRPLDLYDKQVQDGVFSLIENESSVFTPRQIYEAFSGKKTTSALAIKKVEESVKKMRFTQINIDWTEHLKLNGLSVDPKKGDCVVTEEYLLPLERVVIRSNGQEVIGYKVIKLPVMYRYAKQTGQVCSIDRKLLDVPVNNTESTLILRNELLQRIEQIKNPKNKMGNVIRYATIYEIAGVENNRIQKQRVREVVKKMLETWISVGHIKGYKNNKKGTEYVSITIEI